LSPTMPPPHAKFFGMMPIPPATQSFTIKIK
jgi:hypothetical protein